jgi:hypothetical protein
MQRAGAKSLRSIAELALLIASGPPAGLGGIKVDERQVDPCALIVSPSITRICPGSMGSASAGEQ